MFPLKDNIPLARFPLVTVALVAINVIAYLLEIRHGGSFFGGPTRASAVHYGAIPYELTHPGSHCDLVARPLLRASARRLPGPAGGERRARAAQPATWETVVHLDVPARQLPAHLRQHGLPRDLRPHRRGRAWGGCASSPSTCSAASSRSAPRSPSTPSSDRAHARRLRRDRRRARRLHPAVSPRARAQRSCSSSSSSRSSRSPPCSCSASGSLEQLVLGARRPRQPTGQRRRRRLLRPHRRLRLRPARDPAVRRAPRPPAAGPAGVLRADARTR